MCQIVKEEIMSEFLIIDKFKKNKTILFLKIEIYMRYIEIGVKKIATDSYTQL